MKLQWGADDVGTTPNNLRFGWETTARKNAAGFVMSLMGRCVITEAYLIVTGQADAKTKMDALFASSMAQKRNLRFLNDDNSQTTTSIDTANTEGGVYWDRLVWDDSPGAQYATYRKFLAEFSWEQVLLDTWQKSHVLMDYSETVTVSGGLDAFVTHRPVNRSTAVQQTTTVANVWTVTQTGFAVGWEQLPPVNAPLFNTTPPLKFQDFPERSGERTGDNLRRKRVDWRYVFECITAPTPHPTQWTSPFTGP